MANYICVFAILVSPILWFLSECWTYGSGSSYRPGSGPANAETGFNALDFIASLAITILLAVGGLRLHALRRSGVTLVKAGLWASFGLAVFEIFTFIILMASAGEQDLLQDGGTAKGAVLAILGVLIALAVLAFEIIALVWLFRNAKRLQLADN